MIGGQSFPLSKRVIIINYFVKLNHWKYKLQFKNYFKIKGFTMISYNVIHKSGILISKK